MSAPRTHASPEYESSTRTTDRAMSPERVASPAEVRAKLHHAYEQRSLTRRLEDRTLRAEYVKLTRHFPHGREGLDYGYTFANAARRSNSRAPKGQDLRDVLTELVEAAVRTGRPSIVKAVKLDISRYLDLIKAQAFQSAPDEDIQPLSVATVVAAKEVAEALAAIAEAGTTRCPSAIANADRESDEAIVSLMGFKATVAHGVRVGRQPVGV